MLKRMPWAHIGLILGLALTEIPRVAAKAFVAWASLTLLVEIARALYGRWILKRPDRYSLGAVELQMVSLAIVSGAGIGMSSLLFVPVLMVEDQLLLGLIVFAASAGSVAVAQASRLIIAAYSSALLVTADIGWLRLYPHHALPMIVLDVLYLGLLIAVASESKRLLRRSIAVRRERDQMVRRLEQSNVEVLQAVRRAEDAAMARSRVLAAASHDLRQPLHALSLYSAILNAEPEPEALREVSSKIDEIVHTLGSLVHGLLDLSQLSTGHYVPQIRTFRLDLMVSSICSEYASISQQSGLDLTIDTLPLAVHADPLAISRILRNLVDNAFKYTQQGSVTVSLRREGSEAVLGVRDTGAGIPESEHARIFEEFYQLRNPGRDRVRGVGLGLAIVKRLADLIGAGIALRSREGEGTMLELRIAGVADELPSGNIEVSPGVDNSGAVARGNRTVYVVDDEQDIVQGARTLLELWGYQVHTTTGSEDLASLFVDLGPPDLLMVDLRLRNDEHGLALATRMRQRYGAFAVIVVTGETSSSSLAQAKQSGYGILHKPISAPLLRQRIEEALAASAPTHRVAAADGESDAATTLGSD
jgi:signal transduction histidine kinase/FixJ family two-component response regulator